MALSQYKIPIVQGVNGNSNPSEQGDSNHPNASYIIAQFNDLIDDLDTNGTGGGISNLNGFTTNNLAEGTNNKYFTEARARQAISVVSGGTYNSTTGQITITPSSGVDHVSLTSTVGLTKTYTIFGDSGETINLGTFTVTDGQQGIQGIQGIQGNTGQQGVQGVTGKSAYQSWLDNGNTGTEADFLLSLKGASGISLDWRGTWNSGASYLIDDAVSYNGSSYIAKTANTNKQPDSNPTDWDLWVSKGEQGIQGIQGLKGDKGDTGEQGIQGVQGVQGVAGTSQLYWSGTQAQYDAISPKDNNTLYLIVG